MPAVDVDLAAVVVDLRRPAAIASGVCSGGTVSIRPLRTPSRISTTRSCPHRLELAAAQGVARAQRVDPVPEQHLGAVDVADAGEHLLVHQQRADRARLRADPAPRPGSSRRPARSGSGPSRSTTAVALLAGHQLAGGRAAQVGVRRRAAVAAVGDQPQPDLPDGAAAAPVADVELAVEARGARGRAGRPSKLDEQVLAADSAPTQHGAVESAAASANRPCGLLTATRRGRRRRRRGRAASRCRVWPSGIGVPVRPAPGGPGSGGRSPVVS